MLHRKRQKLTRCYFDLFGKQVHDRPPTRLQRRAVFQGDAGSEVHPVPLHKALDNTALSDIDLELPAFPLWMMRGLQVEAKDLYRIAVGHKFAASRTAV